MNPALDAYRPRTSALSVTVALALIVVVLVSRMRTDTACSVVPTPLLGSPDVPTRMTDVLRLLESACHVPLANET